MQLFFNKSNNFKVTLRQIFDYDNLEQQLAITVILNHIYLISKPNRILRLVSESLKIFFFLNMFFFNK